MTDWESRFLTLAQHIAGWSKDPSTQVGAVIVDAQQRIVSVGFNGFPRGISDDARLQDREQKYPRVVHAEVNAVLFAQRPLQGCTIYVFPLPPCANCASLLVQAGLARAVSMSPSERWRDSCELGRQILAEAGVESVWR